MEAKKDALDLRLFYPTLANAGSIKWTKLRREFSGLMCP